MANQDIMIMLVDDDAEFRTSTKAALEHLGFTVAALESAQHALKFINLQAWSWAPNILITDLVMDGMGGYQFMRHFNDLYKTRNIPIIVCSKLAGAEDVNEADIAGACFYFGKPVDAKRIEAEIHRVLELRKERKPIVFNSDLGEKGRMKKLLLKGR